MQPSTTFNWGRVITPLRWTARILGGVPFVIWVGFTVAAASSGYLTPDASGWALLAALGVGLIVATFWTGIGELAGGLLLIGAGVWMSYVGGWQTGAISAAALFAVPGALFIVCGWYKMVRETPPLAA